MSRALGGWGCAAALVATLAACSGGASGSAAPAATPSPTYMIPPATARPGEIVITAKPVVDGQMRFRVLGFQDGMAAMFGSHAEWEAKGRYARVHLMIESTDRTNQKFDAKEQLLVAADGRTFHVDDFGQAIKRQPDEIPVGSFVKMEFDLWFDVPKDAKITAVRLFADPPLGAIGPSKGVDVPLP
ncbi:DUF4352 domain-containing protein [Sphaerisporangium sp. TRM90804]|uniref:DUF4352 domain-containing protein n=1 Tax=Sphaerisporangium sp. TRM90804 TaxID=3031113 RepID=UPI002448FA26|nr:DUF4352 domain-containing protein [Sphaerisporangium sp. TRM90804]MDH2428541.1 DUF4352 domain-containing protein [Sphaerisporangium sp. TRM90804]